MSERQPITFDDIKSAMSGLAQLIILRGVARDAYLSYIGVDPETLETASNEVAQEPFELHHGLGDLSVGKLYRLGLSVRQREVVREELKDTYQLGFLTALTLARAQEHADDPEGN